VVDVPRGWTVTPALEVGANPTAGTITVTAPANDGKRYTAAGTATLLVSDGAERTITKPLLLSCPAYVAPEALGITFAQPAAFYKGEIKTVDYTTTGNVAFVKVSDVPTGWTVQVNSAAKTLSITAASCATAGEALVFTSDNEGNMVVRLLELKYASLQLLSASLNQPVVMNTEMKPLYFLTTATATATGLPTGVSGSWMDGTYTVSGTPTVAGTFTYTLTDDNYCIGTSSLSGNIIVEDCTNCAAWSASAGYNFISNVVFEDLIEGLDNAKQKCNDKGAGWRLPNRNELQDMCKVKGAIPGGFIDGYYWSSDHRSGSGYDWVLRFTNCKLSEWGSGQNYIKCVK
jgi:hypothetical protein